MDVKLFLRFSGPTTVLLQTRASRISDVLRAQDVQEFADSAAGTVQTAMSSATSTANVPIKPAVNNNPRLTVASKGFDGKVSFRETDSFQNLSK